MSALDLRIGGAPWNGWTFGPWGRANEWFLLDPNGERYTAREVAELQALRLDLAYLRQRLSELDLYAGPDALHFGPEDALLLIRAMEVVERAKRQISLTRLRMAER